MKIFFIAIIIQLTLIINNTPNYAQNKVYKGDYFGQIPPGTNPEVFAHPLLSQFNRVHGRIIFSPDGKEFLWVITAGNTDKRLVMKQNKDGIWSEPEDSFLSLEDREKDPCYSADGNTVFYQSRKNKGSNASAEDIDLWKRIRNGNSWSNPIYLEGKINSSVFNETSPWVGTDGVIYFMRDSSEAKGKNTSFTDIYFSIPQNGIYTEPVKMGSEINSNFHDVNPVISPDGTYLIFMSNRPGGFSSMMNLYVSFRSPDGKWSNAVCLSNSLKIENIWFPSISYDGKYLFFCGGYPGPNPYAASSHYWVSTKVIENLREGTR